MSELGILAAFFVFVMTAITLAGYALTQKGEPKAAADSAVLGEPELPGARAILAQALRRVGETVPSGKADSKSTRGLLLAAGYRYPSAVQILSGVKFAVAATLGAAVAAVGLWNGQDIAVALLGAICGGGFGFLLPEVILKKMVQARLARIRRGIPVALDLLTLSVEAGQALNQAIMETSLELHEAHPDLSDELAQVNLELRAGKSRAEALLQLGVRNGDPELKRLSSLLIDSDRFGTSLGPALRTHAKYLRTRMRQQAQESARKVSAKLIFPVFFLIFPSVLMVTLGPAVLHMMKHFTEMVK
jgi:tight adherence protein C